MLLVLTYYSQIILDLNLTMDWHTFNFWRSFYTSRCSCAVKFRKVNNKPIIKTHMHKSALNLAKSTYIDKKYIYEFHVNMYNYILLNFVCAFEGCYNNKNIQNTTYTRKKVFIWWYLVGFFSLVEFLYRMLFVYLYSKYHHIIHPFYI